MDYDLNRPWLTLDQWQKDYIEEQGNCFVLCGRQVGKSTAASIKIAECAIKEKKPCDYLVIALTEKQAYALFFKVLNYLTIRYPKIIKTGKDRPTQHEINLKNGVSIMCHAAGTTGWTLHGYTIKKLFIDEAAPMNREIFVSVSPMLSVSGGTMDIISTPRGKEGYFYEASQREDFRKFYVSAEDCPRHTKEFLEREKKAMSKLEYAQEYLAIFLDELKRVYPDELISNCCTLKKIGKRGYDCFLGVDVARFGEDETTFEIVEYKDKDSIKQADNIVMKKTRITDTTEKILELEKIWKFNKIGIDDRAVGAGVFDVLLKEPKTMSKVVGLDNAKRNLDMDKKHKTGLLKEDMYLNMLNLMEQGKLKLLDDDEVKASLASIQYEYDIREGQQTKFRIFGNYSHICEGLVRAVWLIKEKGLNLWVR